MMTMAVKEVENANRYGKVNIDRDGSILSFEEKTSGAEPGLINAGVYMFNNIVFESFPPESNLSLEHDILPGLIRSRCYGFVLHGKFIDIGTQESFSDASQYLKNEGT